MIRIKELCRAYGITQYQLARHLSIAPSTLSQYATGRSEPDLETLKKIATYFDVSIDVLLGFAPPSKRDNNRIADILPLEMRHAAISDEGLHELKLYIEYLCYRYPASGKKSNPPGDSSNEAQGAT